MKLLLLKINMIDEESMLTLLFQCFYVIKCYEKFNVKKYPYREELKQSG